MCIFGQSVFFMPKFTIYSSSAGSGKTFTLTLEFLKLLLRSDNPMYFQRVLAMTFTNDAAGEMKNRILSALKSISSGGRSPILEILEKELADIEPEVIRERASDVFHAILQNYSDFAVKTIDSFVNQVVSAFTMDLGLPFNYEIVLNPHDLVVEAVSRILERIGKDEVLGQMVGDVAMDFLDENKNWNLLEQELVEFGKNIFNYSNAGLISLNGHMGHNQMLEIKQNIKAFRDEVRETTKANSRKALEIISSNGLDETDFTQGNKGIYGLFLKLSNNPDQLLEKTIPNTYHLSAIEKDQWYSKKSPTAPVVDGIKGQLQTLATEILALKTDKLLALVRINKNLLKIPFIGIIREEIQEVLAEQNQVLLSDFNQKILDIVSQEPVPFVYERIGEKYNHILVDEFQDTSDMQFFNLLPLFENALSKNYANLIVGDPKQAIYRWRGGNVRLMLDLIAKDGRYLQSKSTEVQHPQIETVISSAELKNLSVNYRSFGQVVAFNNGLLESMLGTYPQQILRDVFSDYKQQTPSGSDLGGYVSLNFHEKEEDVPSKVVAEIAEICSRGYGLSDIAVLTRTKSEGASVAEALKQAGFPVQSEEALKLVNSKSVKLLVAGMKLAAQPESVFAKFEFLQFFLVVQNRETSDYDLQYICNLPIDSFLAYFSEFGVDITQILSYSPYYLAEYLAQVLDLHDAYVFTFLDFVLGYISKKPQVLSGVLEHWETKKDSLSLSSSQADAIHVTTIHKSKGLEYPVVLMPYVKWKTTPKTTEEVWFEVDYPELQTEGGALHAAPFKFSDRLDFTNTILQEEEELILVENTNILYVGITRAVENLYVWCETKPDANIGKVFKDYLKNAGLWNEGLATYEFGEKTIKEKKEKDKDQDLYHLDFPDISQSEGLKLKAPDDVRQIYGNVIHKAFERIKYRSDVDNVLAQLEKEEESDGLRESVLAVVNHPLLEGCFDTEAEVLVEPSILSAVSPVRRPDRVIIKEESVVVLDYKSGKKETSHRSQLKEYGRILHSMGYKKVQLLLVYLSPLEVVEIQ